ncbi:hypothetical protein CF327_g6845 [Tilletia walkeri]|nr:hypothetical protein CF327_g6845 [Tilletia walkeri]
MTSTSSYPPANQDSLLLSLPIELQAHIMQNCDYFTLKQLQSLCKSVKRLLEDVMFDRILFRSTLRPLSQDELRVLAQGSGPDSTPVIRLHPAMQESRWCVRDESRSISLFSSAERSEGQKYFVLEELDARNESVSCPAINRVQVIIQRYRVHDDYNVLMHKDSNIVEHEDTEANTNRIVTIEDLARTLFQLQTRWQTQFSAWGNLQVRNVLPFPDGTEKISLSLLPNGSVVVTLDIFEHIFDEE